MTIFHHNTEKQIENHEDIFYDLSYDDLDDFVRSCGIVLPDVGANELDDIMCRRAAPKRAAR